MTMDTIAEKAAATIFGKPLVTNVHRYVLTEAMVDEALYDWTWCSEDYSPSDFIRSDGTRHAAQGQAEFSSIELGYCVAAKGILLNT